MATTLGDRLLGRRARPVLKGSTGASMLTTTWANVSALGNERVDTGQYQSYATNGYAGNGVIFAVIGARLLLFSEAQPRILDVPTGRLRPLDDDRLGILEQPWINGSSGELLARMEQDVSLAGNAYIARRGDRLARLRPDWVEIVSTVDEDGFSEVMGYLYSPAGGVIGRDTITFLPEEVAHYSPVPDPLAEHRGMSWMTPVVREVNADIAMTNHKIAFFENAATPNLLIKYAQKLSPETLAKLRDRFEARYSGPDRAWKTAILDEGADLTVVGHSMEQMTFANVQAAGENRIAAAAGVPGIVVGLKEGLSAATYSNYEQAMRRFADGTLRPLWRTSSWALSKFVDLDQDERLVLDASNVDALREGENARAETFRIKATTAGELIRSGYDPATVAEAVALGDLSVLKHTGNTPTALYDPNKPAGGAPDDAAGQKPAAKDSPLAQGPKGDGQSG